ncbi:MAG: hypothetical protein ACRCZS_29220 [Chroococcidiopsis sp.]
MRFSAEAKETEIEERSRSRMTCTSRVILTFSYVRARSTLDEVLVFCLRISWFARDACGAT